MTDQLPDPLVPAEIDLRGLEYMPLLGGKLFNSDFNLDADDAQFRVALRLWWAAWNQVPAGSLPSEDNRLQKLAGLEEGQAKWKRVRERALHGFIRCSDGRLYHPVIAAQAVIAWEKRVADTEERSNESERKRRERDDRKRLMAELRERGVVPVWNIAMGELRKLHAQHVTPDRPPPVTVTCHGEESRPDTRTDTAKTGRDGTGQEKPERAHPDATTSRARPSEAEPDELVDPSEPAPGSGTPYGLAALAMRQQGMGDAHPGHADLRALVDAAVSIEEFQGIAKEAVDKRKGFAWALAALRNRRAEAAAKPIAAVPEVDWRTNRSTIVARAVQLGLQPWDVVEAEDIRKGKTPSFAAYLRSVEAADARQGSPA